MFGQFRKLAFGGRPKSRGKDSETTNGLPNLTPPPIDSQRRLSLQVEEIRSPSPANSTLTTHSESRWSSKKDEAKDKKRGRARVKKDKDRLDKSRQTRDSKPTSDHGGSGTWEPPVCSPLPPAILVEEYDLNSEVVPKISDLSADSSPRESTATDYKSQQFIRLEAILNRELSTEERKCLPARGTSTDVNALVQSTIQSASDAVSKVQKSQLVGGLKLDKALVALQKVAVIGDIAIQHSPEFTALAWAGVRFLLQVAINDIETRESLEAAMDTIIVALGNCGVYEELYFTSTAETVNKLAFDMTELYAAVIIFSIKARKWMDGRLKRGAFVRRLTGAMVPFEVKFKLLINTVKEKGNLVENAARLAGLEDNRTRQQELKIILSDMKTTRAEELTGLYPIYVYGSMTLTVGVLDTLAQERKYLRNARRWLGGLDIDHGYEKNNVKRTENTCTWILKSPEYQQWLMGKFKGILWICGIPGAGKSVIASYIVSTLKGQKSLVLHYFFQHDFPKTSSALTMAATITDQLLFQNSSKDAIENVKKRYEHSNSTACEDFRTIWATFLDLVGGLSDHQKPIYVIIDAVDECSIDTRGIFLNALCASDWKKLGVRFLVTSRQIADISIKLEPNIHDPQALKLRLGSDPVMHDIKEYIEEQLAKPEFEDIREHRKIIMETVPLKADGMFKYAVLLLETLNERSEYKVTEILDMIPDGLDGIYQWILDHLEEGTLATRKKIFMWVMVSERPITLEELGLACMTRDGEENFDPKEKVAFGANKVLKACGPLVEVGPNKTVQFSHFTAKEFLQMKAEKAYNSDLVSECIVNEHMAHVAVLTTCMTHLLSQNFLNSKHISLKSVPYSVTNWMHHAEQAQVEVDPAKLRNQDVLAWKLVQDFLDDQGSCFTKWKGILPTNMAELRGSCLSGNRNDISSVTALHVTATWGLSITTQRLLKNPKLDVEVKDKKYGQTPLSWAAEHGHTAVVEMFLEAGADTEARDKIYGQTPLILATKGNHREVVKVLVKKGGQLEAASIGELTGRPDRTALLWAARANHTDILRILVEAGADTEAKDEGQESDESHESHEIYERTALIIAAMNSCTDNVKCLLDHGANINALDARSRSALSHVAELGDTQMVQLLLDQGADVHSKAHIRGTKKRQLSEYYSWDDMEFEDAMESVLEEHTTEPTVDWQAYGRTPLSYAASSGQTEVVRMLLERNVNVEAMDQDDKRTPLSWASGGGFTEVARLLCEHHADLEAKDATYCYTPLCWAAGAGHLEMVKMLLEKGAVIEGTPLILAAGGGWTETVKLLLDRGCQIETKDEFFGRTALSYAAEKGHTEVLMVLVDTGANVNATDVSNPGQSPLAWAAQNGHVEAASLLLQNGADIEAVDSLQERTPLSWAAFNGHLDIGQLLLDNNANIEGPSKVNKPKNARSPLSWAAENGNAEFVELLLERGAAVDKMDQLEGKTPLLWAAANGHGDVLNVLLSNGASVNVRDKNGRSPLAWATKNGHKEVLSLLCPSDMNIESIAWGPSK